MKHSPIHLKNQTMKKIKLLSIFFLTLVMLTSCEETIEAPQTNYITFSADAYSAGVDAGSTETVDVTIFTANVTAADRTFDLNVDGSGAAANSYTVPTSFTIPGGTNEATVSVVLSDTNLGIGVNTVLLSFGPQEGLSTGSSAAINYIQNCTEVTATLDIVFDGYGSETGWEVYDALGGVVASKPVGTYADGQVLASETFQLCSGRNYTFKIIDSFGDGLSFPADGSYSLSVGGTVKASGGGDFGDDESTNFDTN